MAKRFRITLDDTVDPNLLTRVENVFEGENLIQIILHAHLLMERAITQAVTEKLRRPKILVDGKYGRWSFSTKLAMYVGLCDPDPETEQHLFAFNRLRNMIAHRFDDEEECVAKCLPWDGWDGEKQTEPPDARAHVWVIALNILFDLKVINGISRLDEQRDDQP